jgi:hypothetical protein
MKNVEIMLITQLFLQVQQNVGLVKEFKLHFILYIQQKDPLLTNTITRSSRKWNKSKW